jgi:hypothetical protein
MAFPDRSYLAQKRNGTCYFPAMATASVNPIGHLRGIDWRQPSVIAMVLANLVPVFGVLVLHWEVFPLMFLFWSENVIVGAFNVLKMLTNQPASPVMWIGKIFFIPFFCFHYGMFTLVHGMFVIDIFGGHANGAHGFKGMHGFPGPAEFWNIAVQNQLVWAILGLAVSRGVSFVANYIGKGEYQRVGLQQLMGQPYGRVMIMHVAILVGGFLMMALHSPVVGLLLLVILKTMFDLGSHVGERKKFAPVSSKSSSPFKKWETRSRVSERVSPAERI